MSQGSERKPSIAIPLLLLGKDEMNLAEFPIARLGRSDTRLVIEYEGRTVDKSAGILEQKWTVSGSAAFGLPTEFAERVLVALVSLTAREGFRDRKVPFTIYRVIKILGLTHNQRNYQAVENALQQLVGVTIYSEGAFYDKATDKRVTTKKGFHLLEEFWLRSQESDETVSEAEGVQGYVIWGERIWDSFEAGYIKNLDTDFYYSLENTIARRLYRFLDKRMHYQDQYQIDIFELAARLGMMTYDYPSQVARKLQPALDELLNRNYLAHADLIKVGKFSRIRFVREKYFLGNTQRSLESAQNEQEAQESPHVPEHDVEDQYGQESPLEGLYRRFETSEALQMVWLAILQEFEHSLPWGTYRMVARTLLLAVEEGEATIGVEQDSLAWMEQRMGPQVLAKLNGYLDVPVHTLKFVLAV